MQQFFDPYLLAIVSIPRSEFWSFGRLRVIVNLRYSWRFQFLGRNSGRSDFAAWLSRSISSDTFQFLGRNSGRSDNLEVEVEHNYFAVSIPRSEFWSFRRDCEYPTASEYMRFNSSVGILVVRTGYSFPEAYAELLVSIPRSEFWSFGRDWQDDGLQSSEGFQFLGRNSGRSDLRIASVLLGWIKSFNSSVGILVVRTQ